MAVAVVRGHEILSIKTLGTNNATVGVAAGAAVAAGNTIVAWIIYDNAGTASKPRVTGIAKAAGETANWVELGWVNSTSTSIGAFSSGAIWAIKTTVAWPAPSTYVVTLDTSVTMKATVTYEYSGLLTALRSTTGSAYSTTTTAASATTTGTTPSVGDLAVGLLFHSNSTTAPVGDTDTSGGSWAALAGFGSSGGTGTANNSGQAQHKILTAASHQTLNNSAVLNAGNGSIVAILQFDPVAPVVARMRNIRLGSQALQRSYTR